MTNTLRPRPMFKSYGKRGRMSCMEWTWQRTWWPGARRFERRRDGGREEEQTVMLIRVAQRRWNRKIQETNGTESSSTFRTSVAKALTSTGRYDTTRVRGLYSLEKLPLHETRAFEILQQSSVRRS